jgi:hypothetical protein
VVAIVLAGCGFVEGGSGAGSTTSGEASQGGAGEVTGAPPTSGFGGPGGEASAGPPTGESADGETASTLTTAEATTAEATTASPSEGPMRAIPIGSEVWAYVDHDLGDVDGDGVVDLVTSATGSPPRVTVYPGSGDGTFDKAAGVDSELFAFSAFVVADVTGDGRADVLAQGTGAPPRVTVYAGAADATVSELATTEVYTFTHMHALDLDGDAAAELLTGKGEGSPPSVLVWPGGAPGIGAPALFAADVTIYALLRGGDVDGDGDGDVVTLSPGSPPQAFVHAGDGTGKFAAAASSPIFNFTRADVGDVDGDGRADLVTDSPGNAWILQVYRRASEGFAAPVVVDGFNYADLEIGDVDGDGRGDVVVNPDGAPPRVEVYLNVLGT